MAVVGGDGAVQLPPEVLADFPPGTLFSVTQPGETVTLERNAHQPPA